MKKVQNLQEEIKSLNSTSTWNSISIPCPVKSVVSMWRTLYCVEWLLYVMMFCFWFNSMSPGAFVFRLPVLRRILPWVLASLPKVSFTSLLWVFIHLWNMLEKFLTHELKAIIHRQLYFWLLLSWLKTAEKSLTFNSTRE